MTENADDLQALVLKIRRTISADGYPMSIGEVTNLYREGELIIRPEFQRFFRWKQEQKSRLVESLLLGIPLPSIFVSQLPDGKWELVDGLQRISTILELQGELLDSDGRKKPALELTETKFLPDLAGRVWESEDSSKSLSPALRLDIKRSRLDMKIIKRESSPETKYDLFQRLNSYGSQLTAQEIRSALLVAISSDFFAGIERLAATPSFVQCTQLTDRLIDERYDLELVLRFLTLHNLPSTMITVTALRDFSRFLDDKSVSLASQYPANFDHLSSTFERTFNALAGGGNETLLRRWDQQRGSFVGPFLNSAFEIIALGVGFHVANGQAIATNLVERVKYLWNSPEMQAGYATGRSTETRLAQFIPLGRELFDPRRGMQ